jgi:AhpD family alkylhydroperoxidase
VERSNYADVAPDATHGLNEIERYVRASGLPPALVELVRVRVSQINGCAYCLALHTRRARKFGVSQAQLDTPEGWAESTVFSPREQAALRWAEALTRLSEGHVPDTDWVAANAGLTQRELVDLTMVVVQINSWNRIQIAFRRPPIFETPAPAIPPVTDGRPASDGPSP